MLSSSPDVWEKGKALISLGPRPSHPLLNRKIAKTREWVREPGTETKHWCTICSFYIINYIVPSYTCKYIATYMLRYAKAVDVYVKVYTYAHCCKCLCTYHFIFHLGAVWEQRYSVLHQFVCYDDGCHLKKYSQNPSRSSATETMKLLASLNIVVDKMHMKGHTDSWCKKHCDPRLFSELDKARMCW